MTGLATAATVNPNPPNQAIATSLDLSWIAVADPGAVYDVFQSSLSGCYDFTAPVQAGVAGTITTVTGLNAGTPYFFVVRARDAAKTVSHSTLNDPGSRSGWSTGLL